MVACIGIGADGAMCWSRCDGAPCTCIEIAWDGEIAWVVTPCLMNTFPINGHDANGVSCFKQHFAIGGHGNGRPADQDAIFWYGSVHGQHITGARQGVGPEDGMPFLIGGLLR